MARSTPRTWVYNELVTAAIMNAHVRDQLNAYWPYTTAGDQAYASAADTVARLAIGTAGEVLRVNAAADAPAWGGIVYGSIYAATDTTLGTAADTLIEMDTSYINVDSFVATPVNDRITIPAGFSGYYLAHYYVLFQTNATGYRTVKLRKNAGLVDIDNTTIRMPAVNGAGTAITGTAIIDADATDYITVCGYQTSGGNLDAVFATLSLSLVLGD